MPANRPYVSATDYGMSDGILLEKGAVAPSDHVTITDPEDEISIAIPTESIYNSYNNYSNAIGSSKKYDNYDAGELAKPYAKAKSILSASGVFSSADSSRVNVGVNSKGAPVYADSKLNADTTTIPGQKLNVQVGSLIAASGGFSNYKDIDNYHAMGALASSPEYLADLDNSKSANNPKEFIGKLGRLTGTSLDQDSEGIAGYEIFDSWGQMSAAQKSVALNTLGFQTYKFSDGKKLGEKDLATDTLTGNSFKVLDAIKLSQNGVNTPPLTRLWDQANVIQDTMFTTKSASEIGQNISSIGLLGVGIEGASTATNEASLAAIGATPASNVGVGAININADSIVPKGYVQIGNTDGKKLVIPEGNVSTASISQVNPKVVQQAASEIHKNWEGTSKTQVPQGLVGGSAFISGLSKMAQSNPYTLGAVATHTSLKHVDPESYKTPMDQVVTMSAVTLGRLTNGNVSKEVDNKSLKGFQDLITNQPLTKDSYDVGMRDVRARYAKSGIPNMETGYQLSNQAYAEGRINESELVTIQNSLKMVYDKDGYVLSQKLLTGRDKGISLLNKK